MRFCSHNNTTPSSPVPLVIWGHGNTGGGPLTKGYDEFMEAIIGEGDFVVAAYQSCWVDGECLLKGQGDFLEILKIIEWMDDSANVDVREAQLTNMDVPVTISGHSSGARAVLIAAALKDSPDVYAKDDDDLQALLTPSLYQAATRIGAVVSNHPDKSYNAQQTPDVPNFDISKTPTMIITGSLDYVEEENSAWKDFGMMSVDNKVFFNVRNATHGECTQRHRAANLTRSFAKLFALGDESERDAVYTIPEELIPEGRGARNSPETGGYLACSEDKEETNPVEDKEFCLPFNYTL